MSVKNCYLCKTKGPPRGRRRKVHGFHVEGLGMVDFGCPVTEEAYERDLAAVADAVGEMRKGETE